MCYADYLYKITGNKKGVMHEGKMTGEITREEATEELVMKYAAAI